MSTLSSIFDPLGLLAPITIKGKLLLQQLWLENCKWDDLLEDEFIASFNNFFDDLNKLTRIQIPRYIRTSNSRILELHGFGDASSQAYSAVISDDSIHVTLVCAKTKIAPTRSKCTIPELELCAALLITELLKSVAEIYNCPLENQFAYSDSTIVLSYLAKDPTFWKVFVANRVAKIIQYMSLSQWGQLAAILIRLIWPPGLSQIWRED